VCESPPFVLSHPFQDRSLLPFRSNNNMGTTSTSTTRTSWSSLFLLFFPTNNTISIQMEEEMSQDVIWEKSNNSREWENGSIQTTVILIIIRLSPFTIMKIKKLWEKLKKRKTQGRGRKKICPTLPLKRDSTHHLSPREKNGILFLLFV